MSHSLLRVFVGAPLTTRLVVQTDGPSMSFDVDYRAFLTTVLHELATDAIFELFSAHLVEDWGDALREPGEALFSDLRAIQWCDVLVAIDPHDSPGLLLEIGAALALGKMVVQALPRSARTMPYLNQALGAVDGTRTVRYDDASSCVASIREAVSELAAAGTSFSLDVQPGSQYGLETHL